MQQQPELIARALSHALIDLNFLFIEKKIKEKTMWKLHSYQDWIYAFTMDNRAPSVVDSCQIMYDSIMQHFPEDKELRGKAESLVLKSEEIKEAVLNFPENEKWLCRDAMMRLLISPERDAIDVLAKEQGLLPRKPPYPRHEGC